MTNYKEDLVALWKLWEQAGGPRPALLAGP